MNENLPYEIDFSITSIHPSIIKKRKESWESINYTNHFIDNAEEIINSRFPDLCYDHIPGMEKVFETMVERLQVTPLESWERQGFVNNNNNKISNSNINEKDTNILKFHPSEQIY
jgi:hypothetical protein